VITTSGQESRPGARLFDQVDRRDKVIWAIDYPYQPMAPAVAFMDSAPISDEDREKIYHGNAERIFHIAP
jgi:5-carboxyvanillate decarboxylase